ncbi:sec1 family domain-containing protein 2-like isoform X2 [Varroa jacobsoni]|uniref:sec1 family domain-containing protein 2-like isoform X2 n=1 Tax=Varroa jacobsoni TaxID=62625 RepID=UPI000BF408FE|nr:sec1 family domain-containing protein 2-like isoform X2 [Varroa jacobsoni]
MYIGLTREKRMVTSKSETRFADVTSSVSGLWDTALKEARNSVVFLDVGACESLRWAGGVSRLQKAGATAVKDFSHSQASGPSDTRALFLLSGNVQTPPSLQVIRSILEKSCFESVTVVTGAPIASTSERTAAQEVICLQRQLRNWMGSDETVSKVVYIPIGMSSVLPHLLVLSPLCGLFPPLIAEDASVSHQILPPEKKALLAPMISSLSLLIGELELRDELFSLGRLGYTIADELEHFEGTINRRKQLPDEAKKACVLLFDRSLDLVAPLSYGNENILDIIRAVLPAFDSIDVSVDMIPICHAKEGLTSAGPTVAKGTLSCLSQAKLAEIHDLKWKLSPLYVKNEFITLTECCGLQGKLLPDEDPVHFVRKNLQVFRDSSLDQMLENGQTLVAVAALSEALSSPAMQRRCQKLSIEKMFTHNATENSLCGALDAGEALVQLAEGRGGTKLDFEDLVSMFLYINSFCGEDLYVDQRSKEGFQQGLLAAITEDTLRDPSEWSDLAKHLVPSLNITEAKLQAAIAQVEEAGARVAAQRKSLKSLCRVLTRGDLAHPSTYRPLLVELVETLKASVDCPDIEAHSSSGGVLGGIQGGLGFLMGAIGAAVGGTTAGYLERADVLMVVILGGVTFTEVAMLKQLIADTGKQLIVITTSLLTPKETLKHIFTSMV